ncbi:MAG: hypothetical protein ACRED9_05830 [Caulobacteraceae bacterium]
MRAHRVLAGATLAAAALFAGSSGAAVIPFSFPGTNLPLSVVGTLTTTGGPNGVFGEDVTAMSGTVNGAAFTFIPDPTAPSPYMTPDNAFNYDDNFDIATSSLDSAGLLFDVGNVEYNLYNVAGSIPCFPTRLAPQPIILRSTVSSRSLNRRVGP